MLKISVDVNTEIGELESVIIHTPGPEVENMTPESTDRALYSDILNLQVLSREYDVFAKVLGKLVSTYELRELFTDVMQKDDVKDILTNEICTSYDTAEIQSKLLLASPEESARLVIEGVMMEKDNLTKYLDKERYAVQPLHNLFFIRDASVALYDQVLICSLAKQIRKTEALIMKVIFDHHPLFMNQTINPVKSQYSDPALSIEGGDILVVREDLLLVGQGSRTSTQGIDYLIEQLKQQKKTTYIIVQELPCKPESFIHLDMVFTFLDRDACMVYKPLILGSNRHLTVCIKIDNGKVQFKEEQSILAALKKRGIDLKPIYCGGDMDTRIQEREQWHSGANFFCLGPGKVIGYGRNEYTIESLNNNGFEVIPADTLIANNSFNYQDFNRSVITIEGSELSRGGGGCRCMTMPIRRKHIDW